MAKPSPCWLVLTDVDAVQSYLFASVRLAMIAGASQIVAEFDERVGALARKYGGEAVIHAGGIGATLFDTEAHARKFADGVEARFRRRSVSGHLTTSEPVELGGGPDEVRQQVETAKASLCRRKNEGFAPGETMTHPLAVRCSSCGREPATDVRPVGDELWRLGPSCLRQYGWRKRQGWLELLRRDPDHRHPADDWSSLKAEHLARKFDELAGDGDLGLIVADGDGIGRLLDQLKLDPRTQWKAFSRGLDRLMERSLGRALRAVLKPFREGVLAGGRMPVQVLFRGGDDIVIACRGDLALPLAAELVLSFSRETDWEWLGGRRVGLSAGVVVTRVGFPFRTAHAIAEGLLREAKRTAQDEGCASRVKARSIMPSSVSRSRTWT